MQKLNDYGTLQYGDLMGEKFSLEKQVCAGSECTCKYEFVLQVRDLTSELEKGEEEFQKLSEYISNYQSKTTEKVREKRIKRRGSDEGSTRLLVIVQANILKQNLAKADEEIAELDKLLEHVRKVSLNPTQPQTHAS